MQSKLVPNMVSLYTLTCESNCEKNIKKVLESSPVYADAQGPLEAWHSEALRSTWTTPQDIKGKYRSASFLKNNRVVFNIAGTKYRLIVAIDYRRQTCFVKFVGTHKEYDVIDAEVYDGYSSYKE